jgi:hypothetical protein
MKDVKLVVVNAEELQGLIADAVRSATAREPATEWVDSKSSPLSRGRFRRLAREKAFPSRWEGPKRVALRADVDAYLASELSKPRSKSREPLDDAIVAALAEGKLRVLKGHG